MCKKKRHVQQENMEAFMRTKPTLHFSCEQGTKAPLSHVQHFFFFFYDLVPFFILSSFPSQITNSLLSLSRTSYTLHTACDGPDLARGKDGGREIEPKCKWRRRWSRQRSALMEIWQKTSGDVTDSRG
jgi:hypothetical protein